MAALEELRNLCRISAQEFRSQGLAAFCRRQAELLTDEFFVKVKEHISDLKSLSQDGRIVIGSGIGNGMKGARHILRRISNSTPDAGAKRKYTYKTFKTFESNTIRLDNFNASDE